MRKPRDFDSELKALGDRARELKAKRIHQLGELVVTCGADALDAETLAGLLLGAIENDDKAAKEAWRSKGAAFFQGPGKATRRSPRAKPGSGAGRNSGEASA
jgi:ubiquitin